MYAWCGGEEEAFSYAVPALYVYGYIPHTLRMHTSYATHAGGGEGEEETSSSAAAASMDALTSALRRPQQLRFFFLLNSHLLEK
jgi:hypothetical protein